jgi:hypothetical protein
MRGPTGTVLVRCALVVGLLIVPGCTDDPEQPGTLSTRSPSPTPTTTSASPATPEEQIEATMQDYFASTNEAFTTGDVSELRSFTTTTCPCRRAADDIEETVAKGGRFEHLRYEVKSIRVHDIDGGVALAEVIAKLPPYKVYDGNGDIVEDSPGGRLHTDFSLSESESGEWIIGNAVNLS